MLNTEKLQAALDQIQRAQKGLSKNVDNDVLSKFAQALDTIGKMSAFIGPKGPKPVAGIDYPIPKNGKDGEPGRNGKDGKSIKGPKGDRGYPGRDADISEVIPVARETAKEQVTVHEGKFKHENIHEKHVVGKYEIADNIVDGQILQVEGNRIVGVQLPKQQSISWMSKAAGANRRHRIKTVTSSEAIDPLDDIIHVDASSGNITLTFYSAAGNEGNIHYIKRVDNTLANTVSFAMDGSETLDFETLYQLVNRGSGAEVYNNGSNWFIKHA